MNRQSLVEGLLQTSTMVVPRLQSALSRSGEPNVEVDGAPYHSTYDPRREAQKFYGQLGIEKADIIFHFGWGLGYAGDVLRERMKRSARVVIFEPYDELFRHALAQKSNDDVLKDERFCFVTGTRVCQFFDEWVLDGCRETDEFLWLEWPAAVRHHAELAAGLRENFKKRLRDKAANLFTHFQNGSTYFRNVLANFKYQSDPDVGGLFGKLKGRPLVLVSAGPSLDRNIFQIRSFTERCFVLAVDTALRPLLASNITPHAVIIADPSELNAKHVVGCVPDSTYLIAEQAVHSSALSAAHRRYSFGVGLFPDALFAKFGFAKSRLNVWGSVATAALDLACRMEADPIIFVGQDFAYSWGRDYASHTMFDGNAFDAESPKHTVATDIWNRPVRTTENLIAYRDYFIRKIRQTKGVRFINATEGGILRDPAEILSLEDALTTFCTRPVNAEGILKSYHHASKPCPLALEHLRDILQTRKKECGCLDGFLELTAKEGLLRLNSKAIDDAIAEGCTRLAAAIPGSTSCGA